MVCLEVLFGVFFFIVYVNGVFVFEDDVLGFNICYDFEIVLVYGGM